MAQTSRLPLERFLRIHQSLVDGAFPNCRSLASLFEVSTKTIQRDIDFLRDRMELPIEYDRRRHGYFYSAPVTHLPLIQTTEAELLALVIATQSSHFFKNTPFAAQLEAIRDKLAWSSADSVTIDLASFKDRFSVVPSSQAHCDLNTFEKVTTALAQHRYISFPYCKLGKPAPETRTVEPYHLLHLEGQWYLFAFDGERQAIRRFAMSRIGTDLEIGPPFEPRSFDIENHLGGSFGIFQGNGSYEVIVEFDAFAGHLVRERHWHASQRLETLPSEHMRLHLTLDSLEEVERWVLSWGPHAKVIQPRELITRIEEAANQIQALYKPDDHMPWAEILDFQDLTAPLLRELIHKPIPENPNQLELFGMK